MDTAAGAEITRRRPKASEDYSGIVIPYRWPGEGPVRSYRLRRDNPPQRQTSTGKAKEETKYPSAPGDGNKLYFSPTVNAERLNDPQIPVVFVEGEKKTRALQRHFDGRNEAVLVIGLQGSWNWKGVIGKTANCNGRQVPVKGVIPDFDRIKWRGREVEIIFDADARDNEGVRSGRQKLATELRKRGATVSILEMPDISETGCKGIDDLLGAKGSDFVAEWLTVERQHLQNNKWQKTGTGGVTFSADETGVYAIDQEGNRTIVSSPLFTGGSNTPQLAASNHQFAGGCPIRQRNKGFRSA